jgi:micrococcal nuclease
VGYGRSALLAVLAGCSTSAIDVRDPSDDREGANAVVVDVIDGDTIEVDVDGRQETVRLIGIDTPETVHPQRPVECFGPEASAFTAELLPAGTAIRLERDIVGRDDYGRLLGYVVVVDGAEETFANLEIVERGFARPLTIEPNSRFAADFAGAAQRAEAAGRGLWTACAR